MAENDELIQAAVAKALEAFEAREAERKAAEEKAKAEQEAFDESVKSAVKETLKELVDKEPAWKSVAYMKTAKLGEGEDARKHAFFHYIRTGDMVPVKSMGLEADDDGDLPSVKAMQEGTATEGGVLVPDDWYTAEVIERRNKLSFIRQTGARIMNTSRDKLSFAVENAAAAKFTLTAEEGTYNDTDRALAQVDVSIYKFTRVTTVSEELLADDAFNLEALLASQFAREEALTENYYVAVGTGSSQPQGVYVGGTSDAVTSSGSAISISALLDLYGALASPYRPNAAWLAHSGTQLEIRKLRDSNNWAFGDMYMTIDAEGKERLINKPFFTQDDIGRASDDGDCLLIGDFSFYAFVERSGLVVTRNPWRKMNTGQVEFFARKRFGGAVLQAEAFQILKTAA